MYREREYGTYGRVHGIGEHMPRVLLPTLLVSLFDEHSDGHAVILPADMLEVEAPHVGASRDQVPAQRHE